MKSGNATPAMRGKHTAYRAGKTCTRCQGRKKHTVCQGQKNHAGGKTSRPCQGRENHATRVKGGKACSPHEPG